MTADNLLPALAVLRFGFRFGILLLTNVKRIEPSENRMDSMNLGLSRGKARKSCSRRKRRATGGKICCREAGAATKGRAARYARRGLPAANNRIGHAAGWDVPAKTQCGRGKGCNRPNNAAWALPHPDTAPEAPSSGVRGLPGIPTLHLAGKPTRRGGFLLAGS